MARKTGSHSEITGPLVHQAAQRLFAAHGYAAVSMRQIAAEVGVQVGALYLYTPDKQTLLFDMMRNHMQHLLDTWAAKPGLGPEQEDAASQLEQFCKFHIAYHLERPEKVFIAYMELRNLEPENFKTIEGFRNRYENELEMILKTGQDTGVFKLPDSRLATMAIIAMLTGVNTWYQKGGRLSRERVERIYWNMIRRAVGA